MAHIYDWGLHGPENLAIKCPRCGREARFSASTRQDESGNRYRDENGRCSCSSCGYANPHTLIWPNEAYFVVAVEEIDLWAWTREHAIAIRDFVASDARDVSAHGGFKLSLVQLPSELLHRSSRERVVKRINQMLDAK